MAEKPHQEVETAPDPDEDDLDDLDDVLDEFQTASTAKAPTPSQPSSTAPSASGPGRPAAGEHKTQPTDPGEEDLAKQLQAGMAGLMGELDSNPEMQQQFEQMMQELIAVGAAPTDEEAGQHLQEAIKAVPTVAEEKSRTAESSRPTAKKAATGSEDNFSSTIRKTMERMQQSDSTASASASTGGGEMSEEDMLAQMMRELQASGGSGGAGGEGGEEDFNKMLLNMMTQLTNKEILYEPMKELNDKYPAWMEKNAGKVEGGEMERYREQQTLVREIVGRFERKGYSDDNEGDREYIVERMQKMQAAGSPPPDLVGDMSAAQEALGDLDQGCPTQ